MGTDGSGDQPLIRAEGLTIGWGDLVLLRDVDFAIEHGDVFVILGGSGCGKSTLLRHLIGLERPKAGTIRHATPEPPEGGLGAELDERPPYGVMFQSGALFGSMTLIENIALPLQKWTLLDDDAIEAVAAARLRLVGLDGFEHHLPAELSGGMKKRAGIARALALEPDVVFFDEPSAGLDPVTAVEIDDLLLTLNGRLGVTVVVVTHELESIFKIADRCIMLDKDAQGIIAEGDPRELRDHSDDARVRRFFNREPTEART